MIALAPCWLPLSPDIPRPSIPESLVLSLYFSVYTLPFIPHPIRAHSNPLSSAHHVHSQTHDDRSHDLFVCGSFPWPGSSTHPVTAITLFYFSLIASHSSSSVFSPQFHDHHTAINNLRRHCFIDHAFQYTSLSVYFHTYRSILSNAV